MALEITITISVLLLAFSSDEQVVSDDDSTTPLVCALRIVSLPRQQAGRQGGRLVALSALHAVGRSLILWEPGDHPITCHNSHSSVRSGLGSVWSVHVITAHLPHSDDAGAMLVHALARSSLAEPAPNSFQ